MQKIFLIIFALFLSLPGCYSYYDESSVDEIEPAIFHGYLFYKFKKAIPNIVERWEQFKKRFGLKLKKMENIKRFYIYGKNAVFITESRRFNMSYELEENEYTHLSREEYFTLLTTIDEQLISEHPFPVVQENQTLEAVERALSNADIDWRAKNKVTGVKNQGSCGSCYAFSVIAALESAIAIKTGKLVSLSEQSVLDCSGKFGNSGCVGGYLSNTLRYLMSTPANEMKSYPYNGKLGACKLLSNGYKVSQFVKITRGNEDSLSTALVNHGPVAMAIDARLDTFRFYKSGIYQDAQCSPSMLNHGVTAVGVKPGPMPFYIIKNSYGTGWGEAGYIRMARGKNNMCGVTSDAYYVVA